MQRGPGHAAGSWPCGRGRHVSGLHPPPRALVLTEINRLTETNRSKNDRFVSAERRFSV
jgi:hypothetical protein